MKEMDRRSVLNQIICGAAVAAVGLAINLCLWLTSRLVP